MSGVISAFVFRSWRMRSSAAALRSSQRHDHLPPRLDRAKGPPSLPNSPRQQGLLLKEFKFLVFDDPHDDDVWNDTAEDCVVLLMRLVRPLRQPGEAVAHGLLWLVTKGFFTQTTRKALDDWGTHHWPCSQRQSWQLTLGATASRSFGDA